MADRAGMPTIRGAKRRVARLTAICSLLVLLSSAFGVRGASASPGAAMGSRAAPTVGGCPVFPADNVWNADVSGLPVASDSGAIVASIGAGGHLHPDFGAGLYQGEPIGIPYVVVPSTQSAVPVSFQYADESDAGPYPIPANAPIEGGASSSGDRHVIVVQSGTCKLYETFASYPQGDGGWKAGSGATWSLTSDALRPAGWTSADAAGLPILPGLVRYDEVAAGAIDHAIRFTVSATRDTYVWPGRHEASAQTSASLPPMGLRLRLKSGVDISGFSAANRVILTALKRYGMIVADNGSSWYLSGAPDERWNNDDLHALGGIPGSDFEVVDTSSLEISTNSGQARGGVTSAPTATVAATHGSGPVVTAVTPTPSDAVIPTPASQGPQIGHPESSLPLGGWGLALLVLLVLCVGGAALMVWRYLRRRR